MSNNKKIKVSSPNTIYELADWFLAKEPMTNKKLQKLCYYAIAWGWALLDRAIVEDGAFEAWVHGPVSKSLYQKYSPYKWNLIDNTNVAPVKFPQDIEELLGSVWYTYGAKDGNELEAISHSEKPWREARGGALPGEICDNEISTETMKNYYWSIYNGKSKEESQA